MKFFYLFITLIIAFAKSEQLNIKSTTKEGRQVDLAATKDYETNPFLITELDKTPDEAPEAQATLGINPENPFLQEYISNSDNQEKQPSKRNPIITAEDDDIHDRTISGKTLFLSPTIEETLQKKQEFLQKLQDSALYTSSPIKSSEEDDQDNIGTSPERAPSLSVQYSSSESSSQPATERTQQSPYNPDNSGQIQIIRNPDQSQQYTINSNLGGQITRIPSNSNSQQYINPDTDSQQVQYTRNPIKFQTNSNENSDGETQYTRIPINSQQYTINSNDNQGQFTRIPGNSQQYSLNSNNAGVLQFLGGSNQGGSSVIQSDQDSGGNILESLIRNTILSGTDVFLGGILNGNGNSNQQESLGGNRIVLSPGSNFFGTQQDSEQFGLPSRVVTTQQISGRPNNIAFPQEQRVQLFEV